MYSKEAEDVEDEVNLTKKGVDELKEMLLAKDSTPEDLVENMNSMKKVLSECYALAAAVTDRERRMKDRLAGLLLQLDREISSTRRMMDSVSRVEREISLSQMKSMVRATVMEETKIIAKNCS